MSEFYLMIAQFFVFMLLCFVLSIVILAIVNLVRGVITFKRDDFRKFVTKRSYRR